MTRRSPIKQPLPDWFNLEAYVVLLTLTNEQIVEEVNSRAYWLSGTYGECWSSDSGGWLDVVSSGKVLVSCHLGETDNEPEPDMVNAEIVSIGPGPFDVKIAPLPEPREELPDKERLPGDNSVWPTSFMALQGANVWAQMRGIFGPGKPGPGGYAEIKAEYMLASLSAHLRNGRIETTIDLDGSTDAEILAELRDLLPKWREQLGLPEPAKHESGATGPSIIKRLIEYQVIPMLDLMIWANLSRFEYSAEQLSRVLYPNEIVTAKHVNDTRQPFAMKFADEHYADMVTLWLRQVDRGTGKRNGDRLVKDTLAMP